MNTIHSINIKEEPMGYDEFDNEKRLEDDDPGSRCGEIYVGKDAKTWTFICTFCDKSMREISEFIIHIKNAHVHFPPPLPVGLHDTSLYNQSMSHSNSMKYEVPQFNFLEKTISEYVDYNGVLDVGINTISEVILSDVNGHEDITANDEADLPAHCIKKEPDSEGDDDIAPSRSTEEDQDIPEEEEELPDEVSQEDDPPGSSNPPPPEPKSKPRSRRRRRGEARLRRQQIKGPAFCQICKRAFQFHSLYRNHLVKHSSETPFKCSICNKGFKSKQAIRYHMTTHQREKRYKCEVCEAAFFHEWQFLAHMETHRGENSYPCEICGKISHSKFEKEAHMRMHAGDRPYGCDFCLRRFRLRHHLSNHLKLHLTYRCDFCKTRFSNDVPLKKPYCCPECTSSGKSLMFSKQFEQNYAEDSETESQEVNFSLFGTRKGREQTTSNTCNICHKNYANKRGLVVHMASKHSIKPKGK